MLLAEKMDPVCGAVYSDQDSLAAELGVGRRAVQKHIKTLVDKGAITLIPVVGTVSVYALNPQEVWRGYAGAKGAASYYTRVFVQKSGRTTVLFRKQSDRNVELEARAMKNTASVKAVDSNAFSSQIGKAERPEE